MEGKELKLSQLCPCSPEDILFCIDVDRQIDTEMKVSSLRGQPLTRIEALKQALMLFVHSKLAMSKDHRFAFTVIGDTVKWHMKDFTSDISKISKAVMTLRSQGSFSTCDIGSLINLAYSEAKISGNCFRVIFFYCRSNLVPSMKNLLEEPQKMLTFDAMYLHDKPCPENCPQNVYDALVDVLERTSRYEGYIYESASGLAALFRQMCSLLAHPPQRCFQENFDDRLTLLAPGINVSKLCLGTMTFGEQNSYEEASELLQIATDAGINFFDTAEMYPVPQRAETHGKSEAFLGRWLKESRVCRDKIVVATKVCGPSGQMKWIRDGPHALDTNNITQAIDSSLQRLSTDYIDLYQIHWPDRYVPMFGEVEFDPSRCYSAVGFEEQLEALAKAKTSGKVRHIGVSNETAYGIMKFSHLSSVKDFPKIVSVQNAYNLLCRTFDSNGIAECCHHERVRLLAYSPLAMGLLTGKYLQDDGGPEDARLNLYKGRYAEAECRYHMGKPHLLPALKAYAEIAKRHNMSTVDLAIGFVLRHPLVTSVVIGATKAWQLHELLRAASIPQFDEKIIEEIETVHHLYPNPTP